jgi:ferredoxin
MKVFSQQRSAGLLACECRQGLAAGNKTGPGAPQTRCRDAALPTQDLSSFRNAPRIIRATLNRLPSKWHAFIFRLRKGNFMADVANKYPENVSGKYYVDNQCIDCDLCRETAPDNFKRNDDGGYSFVFKQPENPEEEARCKEAKEGCPVEAIGDNGE